MVLFCCMVNFILSTNLYKFPTQECCRAEFRFYIAKCCWICIICHIQCWTVLHTTNSGIFLSLLASIFNVKKQIWTFSDLYLTCFSPDDFRMNTLNASHVVWIQYNWMMYSFHATQCLPHLLQFANAFSTMLVSQTSSVSLNREHKNRILTNLNCFVLLCVIYREPINEFQLLHDQF